jgi:hypothetical protein
MGVGFIGRVGLSGWGGAQGVVWWLRAVGLRRGRRVVGIGVGEADEGRGNHEVEVDWRDAGVIVQLLAGALATSQQQTARLYRLLVSQKV